ncbi:MAG: signal recognition particle-docking protein FtsY [Alcaligenaceae bacterium]|nr:signal recognition particle-docking protein FtsY [Alcaligenaceae bacterium]
MFRFFRRKKSKEENNASPETDVVQTVEERQDVEVAEDVAIVNAVETESIESKSVLEAATEPQEFEVETLAAPEMAPIEHSDVVSIATPERKPESETIAPVEREPSFTAEVPTSLETVQHQEIFPVEEAAHHATTVEASTPKASWMQRLRKGLSRTGSSIGSLFVGVKVNEELFEELEMALLMADAGIEATESLLNKLRARVKQQRIEDGEQVREALKELLTEHLQPLEKSFMLPLDGTSVVMIAGVNGAGKTTSIGKLAHHFQAAGASVLLAAGDTFRAAAREQLVEWGKRNNVAVISQDGGDPAAVAFDAVNAGKARKANVVMVDTAGRLPTQLHLMEELKKIKRVINKADSDAPHEVLLVVDGNTGQNVITQIKTFDAALGLTGLVVTKLDGTAKGGTLAAVAAGSQGVRPIPVYWIGVGESLHDLQPFSAAEFANALLGS